jgi:hypothetical protein
MESEDHALMSYPPEPPPPGYGYGPSYGPPNGPPYGPQVMPTNGKATASLITGVASLVLSWCCGLGVVGIVAIVLGVKARNEIKASGGTQQGEGLALGGIITGAIAVLLGVLVLALIVLAVVTGVDVEGGTETYGTAF